MNRTKQRRRPTEAEPSIMSAIFSSLFGLLIGVLAFIAMTLIFAFVALLCPDPRAVARISGYAILYLSSAVGGFATYKRCSEYPLVCGLSFGMVYAFINWLISLLPVLSAPMSPGVSWLMRAFIIAASVGGSFLASYKPKRKSVRRRRK